MSWVWPIPLQERFVPKGNHPGSFGAVRKFDIHTGVDLYAPVGKLVVAVETGLVRRVFPFTGPGAESPWWRTTFAVIVEGDSGAVVYGEISPQVRRGERVHEGLPIGRVLQVLKTSIPNPQIPHHLPSMLHLELYESGTVEPVWWKGGPQPKGLLDPTSFLEKAT